MGMGIFLIWLILSGCVAAYASQKGHSAVGMFLVSLLLSPLLGFVIELVRQPNVAASETRQIRSGSDAQVPHVCRTCACASPEVPILRRRNTWPMEKPDKPEMSPEEAAGR